MSAIIETIVCCDDCGHQNNGDDRHKTAAQIRHDRKRVGWIQIGSKDYCEKCAPLHLTAQRKAG